MFYAAFIGEVVCLTLFVDDGLWCFYTHQTPGTAGKIGKVLVSGRYGCHGTGGIMSCYCYYGYGSQSSEVLYLFCQMAYDSAWFYDVAKLITL